jgi:outer membrane immunogenic protein
MIMIAIPDNSINILILQTLSYFRCGSFKVKRYAFLAVLVGIAGPAAAGGPVVAVVEQPVAVAAAAPSSDWTGFYAGVNLGFGELNDGGDEADSNFYGLQAGYLRDFGTFVAGAELAFTTGDFDDFPDAEYDSTRLKLIGGYDAGRFLPYAFIGLSDYSLTDGSTTISDTATIYGVGGRYALGANGRHVLGVEYLFETKDDFAGSGDDLDNRELVLRYDFRF